jgi:hypothetical protein
MDPFSTRLPEPAPNSMLAESFYFQIPAAAFDGILEPFLKNARFQAVSMFHAGEAK